jgi:hypothetical protein
MLLALESFLVMFGPRFTIDWYRSRLRCPLAWINSSTLLF